MLKMTYLELAIARGRLSDSVVNRATGFGLHHSVTVRCIREGDEGKETESSNSIDAHHFMIESRVKPLLGVPFYSIDVM